MNQNWVRMISIGAGVFFAVAAFAGEESTWLGDKMIASSVRVMAKTYVRTTNLKKLKRTHIERIKQQDDDTFHTYYTHTLDVIKNSPRLKGEFALDENMSRQQAMERLQKIDKDTLCRIIDAVPDSVIAVRFRAYTASRNDELKGKDVTQRIETGWKSIQQRLEK
jgi:hypothetical protein